MDPIQIAALTFPDIDPTAFAIGPFVVRWYALSYIGGLLLGWAYIVWLLRQPPQTLNAEAIGDFLSWAVVGIVVGGRLGYVVFYSPGQYFAQPEKIFAIWQGGMSFHGGLVGMILAMDIFARRRGIGFRQLSDLMAAATPIGLLLGRLANFVNGELYGRPTEIAWGMVFPRGGPYPRHPSQLYEAALEGLLLFVLLFVLARFTRARWHEGVLSGVFLVGYGLSRFAVEFYREPDLQLGYRVFGSTTGQLLSLPLIAGGLWFLWSAYRAARKDSESSGGVRPA